MTMRPPNLDRARAVPVDIVIPPHLSLPGWSSTVRAVFLRCRRRPRGAWTASERLGRYCSAADASWLWPAWTVSPNRTTTML